MMVVVLSLTSKQQKRCLYPNNEADTEGIKRCCSEWLALVKDTFLQAVSDVRQDTLSMPVKSRCQLKRLPGLFGLSAFYSGGVGEKLSAVSTMIGLISQTFN